MDSAVRQTYPHHSPQRKKNRRRRRRYSAAPSSSSGIHSGETFVRVFTGDPLGLVIQADHRVDEVIKGYQGDLAGVLAGDTLVEINHKRIDPTLSGRRVSMQVVASQRTRGRVRIRFYRPLTEADMYMNQYHTPASTDLSSRPGQRGRGNRTSLVWTSSDEGIGRSKGSNESVYEVHNLDLLVSEVDEFVHYDDLSLLECIEKIHECIPKEETDVNGDSLAYLDRNDLEIDKLFSRIVHIVEKDPNESELGRPLFFHLQPWLHMMNTLISNVDASNFEYMLRLTTWQSILFAHSVATERLPMTDTSAELTFALLSPLFPIFQILLAEQESILSPEQEEKGESPIMIPSKMLCSLGINWYNVLHTMMTRLATFDYVKIPCLTLLSTEKIITLFDLKINVVNSLLYNEVRKRACISLPGRPLGSVHGHLYEGSALCSLFPTIEEVVINPLSPTSSAVVTSSVTSRSQNNSGETVKFLVLHHDVLLIYAQKWRPYRGGSDVRGAHAARKNAIKERDAWNMTSGLRAETTISLEGCTLLMDSGKEGFVIMSTEGGSGSGSDCAEIEKEMSIKLNAQIRSTPTLSLNVKKRYPLLRIRVPRRKKETESWFLSIGKAIAECENRSHSIASTLSLESTSTRSASSTSSNSSPASASSSTSASTISDSISESNSLLNSKKITTETSARTTRQMAAARTRR